MTPDKLAILIDTHGATPERWPQPERNDARTLLATSAAARALLRQGARLDAALGRRGGGTPYDGAAIDPARLERVMALTLAAAHRTAQMPPSPSPIARLLSWIGGLLPETGDSLWRFAVPGMVALVFGVIAGHASVDQASHTETPVSLETLITSSHPQEPFGL